MKLLKIWRDGAMACIEGHSFCVNPYGPPPVNHHHVAYNNKEAFAWARGYWWAEKNRQHHSAVNSWNQLSQENDDARSKDPQEAKTNRSD